MAELIKCGLNTKRQPQIPSIGADELKHNITTHRCQITQGEKSFSYNVYCMLKCSRDITKNY